VHTSGTESKYEYFGTVELYKFYRLQEYKRVRSNDYTTDSLYWNIHKIELDLRFTAILSSGGW